MELQNLENVKPEAKMRVVKGSSKKKSFTLSSTVYKAKSSYVKYSIKKAKEVVALIKGARVHSAVTQLKFCRRRQFSQAVLKVLNEAMSNAENNFGQDIDNLVVRAVLLEKGFSLRRFRAKSKGRAGKVNKPFIRVAVELSPLAA
jgi:large subunit ribosomal protein L22